ncbi:MAG: hypothetical protein RQ826_09220, partial [Xanthomonadales bacterium]|nr:hypothetical protein [Xanthomonadales bacterium]
MSLDYLFAPRSIAVYGASAGAAAKLGNTLLANAAHGALQVVAVHPEDKERNHLVGRKLLTPIYEKEVDIIADPKVDPTFGSGVVM